MPKHINTLPKYQEVHCNQLEFKETTAAVPYEGQKQKNSVILYPYEVHIENILAGVLLLCNNYN